MRILHIIDSLEVGGAENLLVGIINGLPQVEHHLLVLNKAALAGELRGNVRWEELHCVRSTDIFRKVGYVRRYVKRNGIDIVHAHLYLSTLLARMAVPVGITQFNSIHSIPSLDFYARHRTLLWLDRLTYKRRHHIIAVSQWVLEDFRKCLGLKGEATVLANYVEDLYFEGVPKTRFTPDRPRLVSVGNLRLTKNYGFALEAMRDAPEGASLDIFGEGDLRPVLEQAISTYRLPVRLRGLHRDLPSLLPEYDVFLSTSLYEGFGIAIAEAMAMGLPLMLPEGPAFRELSGGHALFFQPDDPGSLAKLMRGVQEGQYDLAGLSGKVRARAEDFRKGQYLQRLMELYTKAG